jgi:protein-S-isoprenylcysteine O-methyltransferase Ste14
MWLTWLGANRLVARPRMPFRPRGPDLLEPVGTFDTDRAIHPTAKAEEETLTEQFGEEYLEYKQRVGMFVPKLF